ncbi:MAG TPA: hypothetical protein VIH91_10925 [Terriglobales bacterium]
MISLLLLSLVLSAPSAAAQTAAAANNPLADEPRQLVVIRPEMSLIVEGPQAESFDAMEIHPVGDTCFKIRAYIFSTGPLPKLQRETTCGPKRGELKSVEGAKPKLLPLDASGENATGTDSPR